MADCLKGALATMKRTALLLLAAALAGCSGSRQTPWSWKSPTSVPGVQGGLIVMDGLRVRRST